MKPIIKNRRRPNAYARPFYNLASKAGYDLAKAGAYGLAKYAYNKAMGSKPAATKSYIAAPKQRRRQYRPNQKKSLKQQVKAIQRELKTNTAQLIYKKSMSAREVTTTRNQTCNYYEGFSMAQYETVLAELRFFNPSAPATLIQGSGASGTYDRSYHFSNIYAKLTAVNNYQVPVKVKLYVVSPREDTSIAPHTAFTNGLTDVGAPTSTSPLLDLSDSPEFLKLWKIESNIKKVLMPGDTCTITHSVKDVMYDPAIYDSHALSFQGKFKNFVFVVRVVGVLSHDTTITTEQGLGPAGVDVIQTVKSVVDYDAGIDLKYIVLNDTTASAFTNAAVVSSKPVSDNISYSVA